jgi:LysM repeat protein
MPDISHAQARTLIQADADHLISLGQKQNLGRHLARCSECRMYANQIERVETSLRSAYTSRWGRTPLPRLNIHALYAVKPAPNFLPVDFLRQAAAPALVTVLVSLTLLFTVWRSHMEAPSGRFPQSATAPDSPVSFAQQTATKLSLTGCDTLVYTVQEGDTLAGIARRFSMQLEVLMAYNRLTSQSAVTGSELHIPVCPPTPLAGSNTPAHTLTFTPQAETTFRTP